MDASRASVARSGAAIRIGRARLRGAMPGDRDRLALELDSLRPSAVGVPERAILFVPRLVASQRLRRHDDNGLFASHLTDALRAALRRARRPGESRSADDSLLFLDEAEGAAELIAQWLAGAPPAARDWWPHFTGGAPPPAWWRRRILPDARRLPQLVATLARRGLAEAWLARLEPAEVETAIAAMARSHGLSLRSGSAPAPTTGPDRPPGPGGPPAPPSPAAIVLIDSAAPEARRADLAPPARLLLLLALLVERRPAMLATRAAAEALASAAAGTLPPPRPGAAVRRSPRRTGGGPASPLRRAAGAIPDAPVNAPADDALRTPAEPLPSARPAAIVSPASPRPAALAVPLSAAEIATEFGGLLFVLNALLALGIYGDFTRPLHTLAGLSPFGLLRLLGRAWFGRRFGRDPLHDLLVRLAGGRRADAPRDFEARPWAVPRFWLAPWPRPGTARIGGHPLRPMLWHPAGFPLAEIEPGDAAAAARAARRLGLRVAPRPARLPRLPAPARARWVACLCLYLEARLALALGCRDEREAAAMLCRRPARIADDGEALTARFALDDHPIAIRLAGLDRDPGWVPAAGRSFRYRFE